ncbi:quinoprotein dehydrogenase-associated putative ABC transporter substrate-binding protein [Sphingomonas sp.]|uniref:quinoprotein dehydrogenase-associated putative ABC transporter substrate-binding protein n=1 Tax=Sphingomonas sp. TaxID=28214 RepID=UPI002ED7C7DE
MIGRGLIGVTLALATPHASHAQRAEAVDRSALRVCADPGAVPLSSQDGKGFENQIATALAKTLGVPVRYTWFPSGIGFYRMTLNLRRCDLVIGTVAGNDIAQTTIPYYRSSYVLVTRIKDAVTATRLDDPSLRGRTIGVQAGTPAAQLMARAGLLDTMRSYDLMVDNRLDSVGRRLVDDVGAGRIDAAVVWGPVGGPFAALKPGRFRVTPLTGKKDIPLAFDIAMAVRNGEPRWRAQVDTLIRTNRATIKNILTAAHVPQLPLAEPGA